MKKLNPLQESGLRKIVNTLKEQGEKNPLPPYVLKQLTDTFRAVVKFENNTLTVVTTKVNDVLLEVLFEIANGDVTPGYGKPREVKFVDGKAIYIWK